MGERVSRGAESKGAWPKGVHCVAKRRKEAKCGVAGRASITCLEAHNVVKLGRHE